MGSPVSDSAKHPVESIAATDKQTDALVYESERLQAETQAELDALLPSILDRAFKGEL
jgi:hypothetical protein